MMRYMTAVGDQVVSYSLAHAVPPAILLSDFFCEVCVPLTDSEKSAGHLAGEFFAEGILTRGYI